MEEAFEVLNRNYSTPANVDKVDPVDAHVCCSGQRVSGAPYPRSPLRTTPKSTASEMFHVPFARPGALCRVYDSVAVVHGGRDKNPSYIQFGV